MLVETILGTIVSNMDTTARPVSALFGKSRQAVLAVMFGQVDEWLYLREVARKAGCGLGAVQRELAQLTAAGILSRQARGRQVFFRANRACPIFAELRSLVVKTVGVVDVLKAALEQLAGDIRSAFVFGSWARGEQHAKSDVDVLIAGDVAFGDVVAALRPVQDTLGRDVNPVVYSPGEVRRKLSQGHHFLQTVWDEPKLLVIGGSRELERLAQKRLAHGSQADQTGNSRSARRRRPRSARLPGARSQR
ncbi:MAG: nucleotidyltransferase domain-containing protein [Gemmataceae bacterium]|nr:nucleotidyltransferase domain-containing protein [Gemmataceae bacterium]